MNVTGTPIIVEQTFQSPIATVWQAITDQDLMRQWFFETITDFQPEVGYEARFNVRVEDRDFLHIWNITEVIPKRRIAYGWRYEGYPGDSTVVWELSETPEGTKLLFTHTGIETFPQDDTIFSRESGKMGWDYFIRNSLTAFLERQS